MGKYSQLKENFDLAEQDFEEQGADTSSIDITPDMLSNLSGMSAAEILTPEFLETVGINPSLLNIPLVKSFATNFIDGGGLQKIAAKLQKGDETSDSKSKGNVSTVSTSNNVDVNGRRYL